MWYSAALFTPLIVALVSGAAYAFSFLLQHRAILSPSSKHTRAQQIGFFAIRIVINALLLSYLLRLALIPSILGFILFCGTFWVVLLLTKARINEWI